MGKIHTTGTEGEKEVIEKIKCPNCRQSLMALPPSYPLFDIQCTACLFRAQVKTSTSKPGSGVRGATADIMSYSLKAGQIVPPLILNYKWEGGQEIRFYPFVPRENLKFRQLSPNAIRANLKMFDYISLSSLPYLVLYPKKSIIAANDNPRTKNKAG
jgi:hypothetical protein